MNPLRRFATVAVGALGITSLALPRAHATPITIDWVTVGDAGNAPDTAPAGYGIKQPRFCKCLYELAGHLAFMFR